jgi:hypothetical protein
LPPALRDQLRRIIFFTPWVTIPLGLLGVVLPLATPIVVLVPYGWVLVPVALLAAVALAFMLRPRYRLSILDSSPLGVFYWLQRR